MHLLCLSISHRTADAALRGRLAFSAEQSEALLRNMIAAFSSAEFALLTTCNRTELYAVRPSHGTPRRDALVAQLAEATGVAVDELTSAIEVHDGLPAMQHLFNVAAGIDSMVIGEYQIVGQVKQAYQLAQDAGSCGKGLHAAFQNALAAAKKVRTETAIGAGRVSMASLAVDYASHLFEQFAGKVVLCIGTGKMGKTAMRHFVDRGADQLVVASRTIESAKALADELSAEALTLDSLHDALVGAHVVITCTGATEPIIDVKLMKQVMRKRRGGPACLIDIGLPRDVDPAVGRLDNVYLYDLDHLQTLAEQTQEARQAEVAQCRAITEPAAARCFKAIQRADLAELVTQVRSQLHEMGSAEAKRLADRLRNADEQRSRELIEQHTERLINRILHLPLNGLSKADDEETVHYATAMRRVFGLSASADGDGRLREASDTSARTPSADPSMAAQPKPGH